MKNYRDIVIGISSPLNCPINGYSGWCSQPITGVYIITREESENEKIPN